MTRTAPRQLALLLTVVAALVAGLIAVVGRPAVAATPGTNDAFDDPFTSSRTQWFRNDRFGMFIHFGAYSQLEGEWRRPDGTICQDHEWIKWGCGIPTPEYEGFARQFNPAGFDANAIVQLAKDAGQRYIVQTSKHHDGYAMWPTKVNTWNLRDHSSFAQNRDILAEMKAAADRQGIKFGLYYSIWDWHNPNFVNNWAQYKRDMYTQLKELVDNYHPAVLWFDGEWQAPNPDNPWSAADGEELQTYLRGLDPNLIINNRAGKRRVVDGDFGTPEQEIPGAPVDGQLWESCMTINGTWGYARWDNNWKSATTLTRNLVDIASRSGNYLLNIGPDRNGLVPTPASTALRGIGTWTAANGAAIYGAGYSGMTTQPSWGRITRNGNKLYLAVYNWPAAGTPVHVTRTVPFAVTGARVLGTGAGVTVRAAGDGFDFVPSGGATNAIATVIEADISPAAATPAGGGTGLKAEFWNNTTFSGTPAASRTDPTVNYAWRYGGSPATNVTTDNFSSRWTGLIEPRYSERYTFTTVSDDTVQLWVNGQLVIGNTTPHSPVVDKGGIDLVAGRRYNVRLEQTEGGGEAYLKLIWSSPNTPQQVVPSTQLYVSRTGPVVSGLAGKCADVNGGSSADGTAVQLWDCNGTSAQSWTMAGDGTLRAFGKCLDISGGGTANGATLLLWSCHGGANQQWQSAGLALVNPQSGRCLDVPGSATTNGTRLAIWDCHGGANQRWTLP